MICYELQHRAGDMHKDVRKEGDEQVNCKNVHAVVTLNNACLPLLP